MSHQVWIAGLIAAALVGCADSPRAADPRAAWIGRPASEVTEALGPPRAAYDDGRGGRVLMYDGSRATLEPSWVDGGSRLGLAYRNEPMYRVGRGAAPWRLHVDPDGVVDRID